LFLPVSYKHVDLGEFIKPGVVTNKYVMYCKYSSQSCVYMSEIKRYLLLNTG